MSIATMEEEIVDINVRLWDNDFQRIIRRSFEFPEAWVATSRLDHHLLAWYGCVVTGISEGKESFCF